MKKTCLFLAFFILTAFQTYCCTTFLITKGATKGGSLIVGHTDDDELGDQRIVYVPAKDHLPGSKRAVFPQNSTEYPRYVGPDRAPAYDLPGIDPTKPTGYIDQIPHTYAYIDGNYGILNEHQLAIGECTNSTYFYFEADPKKRMFEISELSRIALERCQKAKDAVLLMGSLAEKYGYYGWGETLLLADKEEGWVFEITCTPKGESALWVAKKVPDGEVFVAANQFRIQEVDQNDPNMLFSNNLFSIAKEENWIKKDQKLNWLQAVCPGEFDHPYYSLRRVWRVFSKINPSLNLSPWVEDAFTKEYPFSIAPQEKIDVTKAFSLFRDHYEGTEFDLTKGITAGPYGCPHRYIGSYDRTDFPNKRKEKLKGAWERSIAIYYTRYSYITEIRPNLPDAIGGVTWIGFDDPYTTCYIPIYAGIKDLPISFQYGSPLIFNKEFAWWAFNLGGNWCSLMYAYAIQDIVKKQAEIEKKELVHQDLIESQALLLYKENPNTAREFLTDFCKKNAKEVIDNWWMLDQYLMEKFRDGFINIPKTIMVGYPQMWLDISGYSKGPISYEKTGK